MIMVIPVHMMTIHQEGTVIEMAMVVIMTIQIIQVVVPTGIHMTVMVRYWFSVFEYHQLEFLGS